MEEFFFCHKCGDDLGDVVQGDCRMDDYAGVLYCDACWIRLEMDYRLWYLRWVLRRSSLGILIQEGHVADCIVQYLVSECWEWDQASS